MTTKEYIKNIIDGHQNKWGVFFDSEIRSIIYNEINSGIYAFQTIYNPSTYKDDYKVKEIITLDYNLCIHESSMNPKGKMWSYDGGKRYQWSEWETLIFDPSMIRNIKLEEVLK